ncbi:4-deoxy-4-formamido-L-arabinose-phosphoundecaprenol deformylase [Candidatus Magnetaquicoccus inordinatus]|uniref:4-deoxy-4-formamido-L-arabinose- phosphoundecaprenol deformylase n=1 Tax=Candidatus Magnetaquicoccus inordinatus TaxID=2496818 RepID=UPI00102BC27F|nr:4-deoxy-4-formamido-L-arabinose-phosphoundecaprenol deformylase [Candidatus Magnetaquicoccus inordinatus]
MRIALKVDVDTLRGTLEGVPALLRLFARHQVRATFLWSLGPDHTGRALRRIFRPGFLRKVSRTSVLSHYGWKTLMYGVLLPGPQIGERAAELLRQTVAEGHESGIHCYDHVAWQDYAANKGEVWTREALQKAMAIHETIIGPPTTHGAAGWQLNSHLLEVEEEWGLLYASDTRGTHPFLPVMEGRTFRCPQLPTTLPTLDELLGREGRGVEQLPEAVLQESRQERPYGHVYTLHAELEGMKLLPVLEQLLLAWRAEGMQIGTMAESFAALAGAVLPRHRVEWGEIAGRSGLLALQGQTFL